MEIEKKFIVEQLPEDLTQYEVWEIEQCYLCTSPAIRARKKNDSYILTYKKHLTGESSLSVSDEVELPLTAEAYEHLKQKADGILLVKTRYRIPYRQWTIELDVFHNEYEGFYMAEVEFPSREESNMFEPPAWFGREVSGDYHYSNSYLSQK